MKHHDQNHATFRVKPMELGTYFGRSVFIIVKQDEDPIIAVGKEFSFYDVDEIIVKGMSLSEVDKIPGIKLNGDTEDARFVSMDDQSIYNNRDFCIGLAIEFNTKILSEIVEIRDKAEKDFIESDEAAKFMGAIVKKMQ